MRLERAAITLTEWRALNLSRPLTDEAIGAWTAPRRALDAFASRCLATNPHLDAIEAGCPPDAAEHHRLTRQKQRRRDRTAARKAAAKEGQA
jgi:hypothetical protein